MFLRQVDSIMYILSYGDKEAEILESQPKPHKRLSIFYQQPQSSPINGSLYVNGLPIGHTLAPQVFVSASLIPGVTSPSYFTVPGHPTMPQKSQLKSPQS